MSRKTRTVTTFHMVRSAKIAKSVYTFAHVHAAGRRTDTNKDSSNKNNPTFTSFPTSPISHTRTILPKHLHQLSGMDRGTLKRHASTLKTRQKHLCSHNKQHHTRTFPGLSTTRPGPHINGQLCFTRVAQLLPFPLTSPPYTFACIHERGGEVHGTAQNSQRRTSQQHEDKVVKNNNKWQQADSFTQTNALAKCTRPER